jgi:hypothetical protein
MKRVLLPLLAAMVAMLVVAAVAGGHGSKGHRSLELVGTEVSFTFVDVDPKQANPETQAPTPGDGFVLSETLTKNGEDFGNSYVQCTFITADVTQCIATLDLPNGQITVQGVLRNAPDFTIAVTGGTGAYSGAGGTLTGHDSAEEGGPSTYTIQFR